MQKFLRIIRNSRLVIIFTVLSAIYQVCSNLFWIRSSDSSNQINLFLWVASVISIVIFIFLQKQNVNTLKTETTRHQEIINMLKADQMQHEQTINMLRAEISDHQQTINELKAEVREKTNNISTPILLRGVRETLPKDLEARACLFLIGKDTETGQEVLYFHSFGGYPEREYKQHYAINEGVVGYTWWKCGHEPTFGELPDCPDQIALREFLKEWRLSEEHYNATKHLRSILAFPIFTVYESESCLIGILSIDSPYPIKIEQLGSSIETIGIFVDVIGNFLPTHNVKMKRNTNGRYLLQLDPQIPK